MRKSARVLMAHSFSCLEYFQRIAAEYEFILI